MGGLVLNLGFLTLVLGFAQSANAGSLTVRDIISTSKNQIEIKMDGVPSKHAFDIDYVRDVIQFSIQNATIYPAKIIHIENQAYNKVFAYQYSPNLVRVRFSVDGKADDFKGKVKWSQNGKSILVTFPDAPIAAAKVEKKNDEVREKSLLAKVLGQSDSAKETPKEVVKEAKQPVKMEAIKENESPEETRIAKPSAKLTGRQSLTDKPSTDGNLGGMKSGPSPLRSFLSMLLVMGGLFLALIVIKKKKNGVQATKSGDSWFSNLLPQSMRKSKSFIEVMGTHSLGPKQSIVVVKIRGQQFVLGVTQDNVQLITQIDAEESEVDLLEDPAVAASIGKMFGGKPATNAAPAQAAQTKATSQNNASLNQKVGATFSSMLKGSTGANAVIGRNAYQSAAGQPRASTPTPVTVSKANSTTATNSVRDQIKRRLANMDSEGNR